MTRVNMRPEVDPERLETIADHYRVEQELGRGGMATVYLCTDTRSGDRVAIKVLKPELSSAVSLERFLREITFASQLDHPQIPKVLGSGVVDGRPFYVMTYIEGESLRARLDRTRQLTIEEAVHITREAIVPTAYAHRLGIIHRDIKPANILLGKDRIYVLDFGVARAIAASADEGLTSTGVAVGTPAYMSPEQALAERNLDARTDIYSLACVTYEMIAGMPPFVGATAQAVMSRRFVSAPPPLSETRESVPENVEHAISKALCKAPADRWQTILEFGNALSPGYATPSIAAQRVSLSARKRKLAAAIGAVALLAIGITGVVAWSLVDRDSVGKARRSLDAWDVRAAENRLESTVSSRGTNPEAQLWMAQTMIVKRSPVDEWKPLALKAADHRTELRPLDAARAEALAQYSDPNSAARCDKLRTVAAANDPRHPDDYTAALTLGDCLSSDRTVVPDNGSRTGYRFKTSYQEAVRLYEGLLERNAANGSAYRVIVPRLEKVLWTTKNRLRGGVMRGDTEKNFMASPALVADTIAFEPVPLGGTGTPIPFDVERLNRFVAHNLDELRSIATSWTRVSPADPDAQEALANVLESVGMIGGTGTSALSSIRIARISQPVEPEDEGGAYYHRLRLANANTRLLVKAGQYRAARLLADSAASWNVPAQLEDSVSGRVDALRLGLFGLTGQLHRALELQQKYAADYPVRLSSGETRKLPAEVGTSVLRLATYSAFGGPKDSIIALDMRVRGSLESLVPSSQLADFRSAVLERPLSFSMDVIGTHPLATLGPSSDPFVSAVRALDAGHLAEAKKLSDQLSAYRSGTAPGEITFDVVFQDAWLKRAIGDTDGAARSLDRALRGVSRAPANLLEGAELATALVRGMLMRSTLATTGDNAATTRAWADAARELWRNADPERKAMLEQTIVAH